MSGTDKIDSQNPFPRRGKSRTRWQRFRAKGETFKRDLRGMFFTGRAMNIWNKLPEEEVEDDIIAKFKSTVISIRKEGKGSGMGT